MLHLHESVVLYIAIFPCLEDDLLKVKRTNRNAKLTLKKQVTIDKLNFFRRGRKPSIGSRRGILRIKCKKTISRLMGFQRNTDPGTFEVFNLCWSVPARPSFNLNSSHQASNMRRKALLEPATSQTPARPRTCDESRGRRTIASSE